MSNLNKSDGRVCLPKILFLVDDFSKGGAARVVETLIRGISAEFTPVLACLDAIGEQGESLKTQGIEVFCLNRQPGLDWRLSLRLAKFIRREKISLIHAHQCTAYFYGALAAIFSGFTKVIFTEHGRPYPDRRKFLQVLFNKMFMVTCTVAVTAVSEAVKQSLIIYEGIPAKKIKILLNGINLAHFKISTDCLNKRIELGCTPTDMLIGMVARLGEEKDHLTLLKAMPIICRQISSARLLIIGDGPRRQELEQAAHELGISQQVIFTGKRHDIPELLEILDLVVLSSFYEGTSITLLESMANGKAILATRVGGNPQVVEEDKCGLLFAPGDYQELAQKAIYLLENADVRKKLGEQGYKRAMESFSSERMIKEYEQLYREVG